MNTKQYEDAHNLATTVPRVISAVDTCPLMVVQYVPALGTGGSAATIAYVVASSMTFLVDGSTPAGADAIGVSGIIDTSSSTYNTMGELVDYINGRQAWRAYLVSALRIDKTSNMLAKAAASAIGDNGLTFYGDTSANFSANDPASAGTLEAISVAISGEKFINNGINGHVKDYEDGCENMLTYSEVQLTFSGTGTLSIYTGKQGEAETRIYHQTLTSTTEKDLGQANLEEVFAKAVCGQRLIVRAATTTAFTAVTKFNINGKTAVLNGSRLVDSVNY